MTNLVVHVDEPAKVAMAISNVQNFVAVRPTSTVVVVVNGPAITTLITSAWDALRQALPQVEIDACHNAMASHQISKAQLPSTVTIVPAGVVRIADLQAEGYAYLRP
ncbi:DsrE family protein [Lactiplantibacillus paraplantarum]|uniref:DsrE family protein n=1 Tax=Lactiplantibacillus paraplantarum TaxID=60520 RepID=UPI0023AA6396|nr:DsrE family protein [Lactiplantibacillus paraplantarum]WEE34925.1 DsrE family protein [Lactiplantibacillus paraplantarum]